MIDFEQKNDNDNDFNYCNHYFLPFLFDVVDSRNRLIGGRIAYTPSKKQQKFTNNTSSTLASTISPTRKTDFNKNFHLLSPSIQLKNAPKNFQHQKNNNNKQNTSPKVVLQNAMIIEDEEENLILSSK